MASNTEGKYAGEFILSEAPGSRSRENVTVLSGQNLEAGHVCGAQLVSPTVGSAAADSGNVGDGAVSGEAVGTNLGVQRGDYRVVFVEEATDLGDFLVYDPQGRLIGPGVVGTEFDDQIKFTIADGAEDFDAGDAFTISVTGGTFKVKEYDPTDADGGERFFGVLYDAVDASAADTDGVAVVRDAEVREDDLTFFDSATTAQKDEAKRQMAELGIIAR